MFGISLELKNRFINTIIFNEKNRFIAWTGKQEDRPILKNLDGMGNKYPKWIKNSVQLIATHVITKPEEKVVPLLKKIFHEIESGRINNEELKFTSRLSKEPFEYVNKHDRIAKIGLKFGRTKGDLVYWYESANEKGYSIDARDISPKKYMEILWKKVEGILKVAGYKNIAEIRRDLLESNQTLITSCMTEEMV